MNPINQAERIITTIESYFSKQHKKIRENIALAAYAVVRSEKVNTAEIARYMGEVNGLDFKANDMRVYRLLQSKDFQVDDKLWRSHVALVFDLLKASGEPKNKRLLITVDYTSDRDDFLILCASLFYQGQSLPLYISMRKYPTRAGMHDQKKMELAFFKALRHVLPATYEYVIVADRGFGNKRVIEILKDQGFLYVLRLSDNFLIEKEGEIINAKNLPHKNHTLYQVNIVSWKQAATLVKRVREEQYWLLATNLDDPKAAGKIYENRFSIEKMFKNQKSAGFDIENINIKKYDRFKRLLFISCVAYSIMILAGLLINNKSHRMKKNSFLPLNMLFAFSG